MQLHHTVFHDNTFEELKAIKACKFMLTMYSWRFNGCWIQIWSSCRKGSVLQSLSLSTPDQESVTLVTDPPSPAEDVFPSCLVLSWHPQHPSYQARRYLNQFKGKPKRGLLLEIVRLAFKCGRFPENCLKLACADRLRTSTTRDGHAPVSQAQLPLTGGTEGQKLPPSCFHGSKHMREDPSVFLVLCSTASILDIFYQRRKE